MSLSQVQMCFMITRRCTKNCETKQIISPDRLFFYIASVKHEIFVALTLTYPHRSRPTLSRGTSQTSLLLVSDNQIMSVESLYICLCCSHSTTLSSLSRNSTSRWISKQTPWALARTTLRQACGIRVTIQDRIGTCRTRAFTRRFGYQCRFCVSRYPRVCSVLRQRECSCRVPLTTIYPEWTSTA